MSQTNDGNGAARQGVRQAQTPSRSIFAVPAPIKQLFDRFPLLTYPTNDLPHRAPRARNAHVLYIYASDEDALKGSPSFNPACLKWQVSALHGAQWSAANSIVGIPQVLQDRLPYSLSKQPRLAEWFPSILDTCFTRAIQAHTTGIVWEATKMGDEQQQEGNRRAWGSAL